MSSSASASATAEEGEEQDLWEGRLGKSALLLVGPLTPTTHDADGSGTFLRKPGEIGLGIQRSLFSAHLSLR